MTSSLRVIRACCAGLVMGLIAAASAAENPQPVLRAGESYTTASTSTGARIAVHDPRVEDGAATTAALVFYALPNGNTLEQTFGHARGEGIDWHYYIQHTGAQTRRLQELRPDTDWKVIYLEAPARSWPTWRRNHSQNAPQLVRQMVETIRSEHGSSASVHLMAHSGGGGILFSYLDAWQDLPPYVQSITWLDANYAFEAARGHADKLLRWLQNNPGARLVVVAYDDRNIVLNGKPIVSPTGGTWRSTMRMAEAFATSVTLTEARDRDFVTTTGLDGRLSLTANTNPENKILHTVLVERNGFLRPFLASEGREEEGFYQDPPAYRKWITGN